MLSIALSSVQLQTLDNMYKAYESEAFLDRAKQSQTDRQPINQPGSQAALQPGRQPDSQTAIQLDREKERERERQTHRHTDRGPLPKVDHTP